MFLDRDERRKAMAVWAGAGALGAAAGPIVGGWIIEIFSDDQEDVVALVNVS